MAANHKILLSAWRTVGIYSNSVGYARTYGKHYNPKFRHLRRKKFEAARIELNMSKEEQESYNMKHLGYRPTSYISNIPYCITSTNKVFDPYVPEKGDGKYSSIAQKVTKIFNAKTKKLSQNLLATRKLKSFDKEFDTKEFPTVAKEIYVMAHEALASKDNDKLLNFATEKAFNLMTANNMKNTIKWKYIESLDPPIVVHVRLAALEAKKNVFAQVTVRFHSKQMLAIYDRFGRLMYGSEILAKDVLEYVVFEKHLPNLYGSWKLHDKIIPDFIAPRDSVRRTYVKPVEKDEEEFEDKVMQSRSNILPDSEDVGEEEIVKK